MKKHFTVILIALSMMTFLGFIADYMITQILQSSIAQKSLQALNIELDKIIKSK